MGAIPWERRECHACWQTWSLVEESLLLVAFSAATQSSNGERGDSSIPCNFSLMAFKEPEDCRNPRGHFQRGGGVYKDRWG